tara:strand:+ start:534 stop:728 length:195 start_codon:yes stop_codon:yes gene_type:complete
MNEIYNEDNREQLTVCLSEIFTEDELSLIVGSLNSFFSKFAGLEDWEEREYELQQLIDKVEDAS